MLQLFGVKHIFGLCGDTSLPLYDALYRLGHGVPPILTIDFTRTEHAAMVADAFGVES